MNEKLHKLGKEIIKLDQQLEDIALQYGCKEGPSEIPMLKFLSDLLRLVNTIRLECTFPKQEKQRPTGITIVWDEENECWKLKEK